MSSNLIRLLKHCVTLIVLVLLVSTCERDDPNTTNNDDSADYTLETLSLIDFLQSDSYIEFEQNMQKLKTQQAPPKQPIASGASVPANNSSIEMVFSGNTVHKTYAHGITYYTVAIKQKGATDSEYDLNLMVIEQNNKRESYIIKYPKDGGNILLQPLNMGFNTHRGVHNEVNEKVICRSYTKTKTVPCTCGPDHTSGACTCDKEGGTKYYSKTVTVTVCWDAPPEMTNNPISIHSPYSNGGKDGSGFRGGDPTPTPTPPVYIYEGEPFCDSNGNCTPQLYWAAAKAWGGPQDPLNEPPCPGDPVPNPEIAPQLGLSGTKGALHGCTRYGGTCNGADGRNKKHNGLDIANPYGAPIYAMYSGVATRLTQFADDGETVIGAGHYVSISSFVNGEEIKILYFHMQEDNRVSGNVQAGDIIGYQGDSGNLKRAIDKGVTISHLHIKVKDSANNSIDPRNYLNTQIDDDGNIIQNCN